MAILKLAQVMKETSLGKSTIYQYINDKKFPSAIAIGDRAVGWLDSEIQEWIEARVKASRQSAKGANQC